MSRQTIEEKKIVPPFIPNPLTFNFDLNEIKEITPELQRKIDEDIRLSSHFETYFSD